MLALCLSTMYITQNTVIMLSNEIYDINQYLQGQKAVGCETATWAQPSSSKCSMYV
jgi:hypothetical protein